MLSNLSSQSHFGLFWVWPITDSTLRRMQIKDLRFWAFLECYKTPIFEGSVFRIPVPNWTETLKHPEFGTETLKHPEFGTETLVLSFSILDRTARARGYDLL